MSDEISIRPAEADDRPCLRCAIIELQEYERALHPTRLPGEAIADAYLTWLEHRTADQGIILVAHTGKEFAGFAACWVEHQDNIAETPDSNVFGYVSDLCVMPTFRGRRIARLLLAAAERHLAATGVTRLRIGALAANRAARRAYRRAGFTPYAILLEKPLTKNATLATGDDP
jgi:ribosomal protein S18 acetylase RimI-like enzyme